MCIHRLELPCVNIEIIAGYIYLTFFFTRNYVLIDLFAHSCFYSRIIHFYMSYFPYKWQTGTRSQEQ